MLLRYVALHGCPRTDAEWEAFEAWKRRQLAAAECKMAQVEASPGERRCDGACLGRPGCTKRSA